MTATRASRVRAGMSSEVFALCGIIFVADVVAGIIIPTFSLFARDLGVSLALLGLLNTLAGVTQLTTSIPLGITSDRIGRTRILTLGLLAFAGSMAAYALADGPWLLGLGRLLQGVAVVSTFQIGAAYLGDITAAGQRSVAFGWFTTAMGLGFTVGPILGGQIADAWSARASYVVAVAFALLGVAMIRRLLHEPPRRSTSSNDAWLSQLGSLVRRHDLTLVAGGNLLMSFTFGGAISTFLPIYAGNAGISEATIGTLFAIRAFVSAAGRIPNSVVTRHVGSQPILLGALVVQVIVMFGIAQTTSTFWLAVLLAFDGFAFGGYLVAGQTWIAERTEPEYRGAAVGLYSVSSSIGGILAPLLLGVIAEVWNVGLVFSINAWILVAGATGYSIATFALRHERSSRTGSS